MPMHVYANMPVFVGLIFAVHEPVVKIAKVGSLENTGEQHKQSGRCMG